MSEGDQGGVVVTENPSAPRYEARLDGALAGFAAYLPAVGMIVLTHTEVEPQYEGQGIGSALARAALDDVRAKGLKVMPLCPFIHAWMARHPDYTDLAFNAPPSRVTD